MPIRWTEPFGMVMVEALACGTPVIAYPEGAAREILIDGENGFLARDEVEMSDRVGDLAAIDPRRCRESVSSRYDVPQIAAAYERVYFEVAAGGHGRGRPARDRARGVRLSAA
jgi:glycosyltransferase involved in cell wall biosynthesis